MLGDELAVFEFDGDAGDLGEQAAFAAGQDAVALFRHWLSQYREKEWRASGISSHAGMSLGRVECWLQEK